MPLRPRLAPVRHLLVIIMLAGALVGCANTTGSEQNSPERFTPKPQTKATLSSTDPIPQPTGEAVLTIKNSPRANQGEDLVLDIALLEAMGTVAYKVEDTDATGRESTFSGPLLATVLDYAGLDSRKIHVTALNDYVIDIPTSQFSQYPIMLATRMNGKTMSITNYGPTRVVYPNVDMTIPQELAPLWIWQVKEISVP